MIILLLYWIITEGKEMKNGPKSNIELPREDKEPKLPSIMVSINGPELEEQQRTRGKKQVKFTDQNKRSQSKRGPVKSQPMNQTMKW